MKERIIYQCNYCNYKLMSKYKMRDHEKICYKKPENKTCWTCINNVNNQCCINAPERRVDGILININCNKWQPDDVANTYIK